MEKRSAIFVWVATLLMFSTQAFGHHGIKTYRTDHLISLKGTVTDIEFVNPHVRIHLEVKEPNGESEIWTIEVAPRSMLYKVGWNKTTLKPKDPIVVTGYQAKDGSKLLTVRRIVLPNGQDLNQNPK